MTEIEALRFEITRMSELLNQGGTRIQTIHDSVPRVDQIYLTVILEMFTRVQETAKGACVMLEGKSLIPLGILYRALYEATTHMIWLIKQPDAMREAQVYVAHYFGREMRTGKKLGDEQLVQNAQQALSAEGLDEDAEAIASRRVASPNWTGCSFLEVVRFARGSADDYYREYVFYSSLVHSTGFLGMVAYDITQEQWDQVALYCRIRLREGYDVFKRVLRTSYGLVFIDEWLDNRANDPRFARLQP
jgi:hypothetical protein